MWRASFLLLKKVAETTKGEGLVGIARTGDGMDMRFCAWTNGFEETTVVGLVFVIISFGGLGKYLSAESFGFSISPFLILR